MSFRTIEISQPEFTPPGVHFITVKSAALRRRVDLSVYMPALAEVQVCPLVTLLHGVYGSHWAWLFKGGAHRVLDRLIQEEALPPMLLAMPSDGLWGDGSGYVQHRDADYRRWIVEEVPAAVAELNPCILEQPRFISGLSMGGYGALRLGALHPEVFAGISAHSSCTDLAHLQGFVEENAADFQVIDPQPLSLLDCLKLQAQTLPPLRFDCGTEDILIEHNRCLHRELEDAGIAHRYEEFPGGHTWEYWHEHLADSLRFFAQILKAE